VCLRWTDPDKPTALDFSRIPPPHNMTCAGIKKTKWVNPKIRNPILLSSIMQARIGEGAVSDSFERASDYLAKAQALETRAQTNPLFKTEYLEMASHYARLADEIADDAQGPFRMLRLTISPALQAAAHATGLMLR
jgi:hypothetical protein